MTASFFADDLESLSASASGESVVLDEALALLWQSQADRAADSSSFVALLSEVFGGADASRPAFQQAALALAERLAAGDQLGLRVELRSAAELGGARGAYAPVGLDGSPTVYVNSDWLATAGMDALQRLLLEEIGHHLDTLLNGPLETPGDEGDLFAARYLGLALSDAELARIASEDDSRMLLLDGQPLLVEANGSQVVQSFVVPLREQDIFTSLRTISTAVSNQIFSIISITATADGTTVYNDHWEDGYDTNPTNPGSTTRTITLNAGESFVFRNKVDLAKVGQLGNYDLNGDGDTSDPGETNTYYADGRDLISATAPVYVARAAWAEKPGSVLAGAVSVYDAGNSGTQFLIPVGIDTVTNVTSPNDTANRLFEYTSLHIVAADNNTRVKIDKDANGTFETIVTLNKGETYLVNGGVKGGAQVVSEDALGGSASKAIAVYMITGDIGSSYENRWFAIPARDQWDNSYFAPVSTTNSTAPAFVFLFNPNNSAITVSYDTLTSKGNTITLEANKPKYVAMPSGNSGAHFYTTGGQAFYAVSTIDSDATSNQAHDWSYSLIPSSYLTTKFVLGWAPGNSLSNPSTGVNGSPVWVTATADTKIYINYDGKDSTSTLTAPNGNGQKYDLEVSLKALQSYRIFDSDRDQTGVTVFTTDGTLLAAAWGQDPSIAPAGNPALDMGYTVLPYPDYVVGKQSFELSGDNDGNIEVGERIGYRVTLTNRSVVELAAIRVSDVLDPVLAPHYVAGSTTLTVFSAAGAPVFTSGIADDGSGTAFPLDAAGGLLLPDLDAAAGNQGSLPRGYRLEINYQVAIPSNAGVVAAVVNKGGQITNTVTLSGTPFGSATPISKRIENTTQVAIASTDGTVGFFNSAYSASSSSVLEDGTLYIQVSDADGNRNAGAADTLTVVVANTATGSSRTVTLTETSATSGIFRGTLATTTNPADPALATKLFVTRGDGLKVDYTDPVFGGSFDNPFNPGIPGDADNNIATGNVNTATTTVVIPAKTKFLYLAPDGPDLNTTLSLTRVDPAGDGDTTTDRTAAVTPQTSTTGTSTTTGPEMFTLTGGYPYQITGGQLAAQSFTITGSGSLVPTSVALALVREKIDDATTNGATITIQIASAATGGTVFYQGTVAANTLIVNSNKETATLKTIALSAVGSPSLTLGTQYFIRATTSTNSTLVYWSGVSSNITNLPTGNAFENGGTQSPKDFKYQLTYTPTTVSPAVPATFEQELAMAGPLVLAASGEVSVVTRISSETGLTTQSYAGITAVLTYGVGAGSPVTIATMGAASYVEGGSGTGTLTWTGLVGAGGLTVPQGAVIKLVVTNTVAGSSFVIDYDSTTAPSRIELPTTSVIALADVDPNTGGNQLLGFFDSPFVNDASTSNDGKLISSADAGRIVYIRVKASDPFGDYDITGLQLEVVGPDGSSSADDISLTLNNTFVVDAAGGAEKIYEYAWSTKFILGEYQVRVTAIEGNEATPLATATTAGSFIITAQDLGTPATIQWITSTGTDAGATYAAGTTTVYLRLTDLDENGNPSGTDTVKVRVNGIEFTLSETGVNTGIFEATISSGASGLTISNGTVLTASYVDKDDVGDTSSDVISIGAAPILDLNLDNPTDVNTSGQFTENGSPVGFVVSATPGGALISGTGITTVNAVTIRIPTSQILDGASERLLIANASGAGSDTALNFASGGTASVSVGGVNWTLTTSVSGGNQVLSFAPTAGGTVTTAQASALLEALRYQNRSENPTGRTGETTANLRSFSVAVTSGSATSNSASFGVEVIPVNDPPVLDLDASDGPATPQTSSITFASSYDVGDVVSLTVDGVTYSHTVPVGGTTAASVYTALLSTTAASGIPLSQSLAANGVTWPASLTSNAVTLTSASGAANALTLAAAINNDNDLGVGTYRLDWTNTINGFTNSEQITITVNGTQYQSGTSNLGTNEARFDAAAEALAIKLTNAGFSTTYDITENRFDIVIRSAVAITIGSGANQLSGTAPIEGNDNANFSTVITFVAPTNQAAPTIDTTTVAADGRTSYATTFTEDGPAVAVADSDTLITDLDSSLIQGARIVLTNPLDGAAESLSISGTLPGGITPSSYNAVTGVLTLSGNASLADYQSALAAIRYNNTSQAPSTTPRRLEFTVNDGVDDSNVAVSTIAITAVNDPPAGTDKTIGINEDGSYTFATSDFGFSDPNDRPANALQAVKITTLPAAGTLKLDGSAVTAGQVIPAGDIAKLVYTPAANASGTGYASFTFQVQDDGGTANGGVDLDQSANTITFNVTAVNDPPAGTDKTIGINEDGSHTFAAADFGFSDPNDTPANSLLAVKITTLPAAGTLKLDGSAVTAGQVITAGDIAKLVYTPAANASGTGYASFTFQVQDDGGTANGGVDLDPTPNTITFNVAVVNDPPLLDLDDSDPAITATGYSTTFNAGGAAVAITASTSITDIDNTQIVSAVITLTNRLDGASESLSIEGSLPNGITPSSYNADTGVLSLTGPASLADFQSALSQLRYANTAATPNSTARVINVTVNDGTANSNTAVSTVSIADPRSISVTGKPDVSEGTNAIFTVALTGNVNGTDVALTLGKQGDTAAASDYNPITNATAYYFAGTVKTVLTINNGTVTLPPGITSFFVSVRTTQDAAYEGPELFTLEASAFGGSKTASGTSTILDNGTGQSYDDKGVPIASATPDDDRTIAVTAYGPVNEGSTYTMFSVSAIAGNTLDLTLQNASSGTPATWAGFTPLEFSTDGTNWSPYASNPKPTVPAGGTVYVRVTITSEQDPNFEGAETFALKAAYTTNTAKSASADTSIVDDGTGKKYGPDFITDPQTGVVEPQESTDSLDADTGLSVNSITVNEGSPFAVFTVSGAVGLEVSLALTNGTTTGLSGLFTSSDNGATWTAYTTGTVPLNASGKLLVRTSLTPEQETLFENSETFTLTATPTAGTAATGTATVLDDGTGTIFNDNGTANNSQIKDDDRVLTVNSITVNEGSTYAVFTLSDHRGQSLSLGLSNGIQNTSARPGDGTPADGTEDYDPTSLQVWDPTSGGSGAWVAYTGPFTVPGAGVASTPVLVRLKINPDAVFEGPEDVRLTATYTSGAPRSATGTATIVDNGTGTKFPDAPPNAGPSPVTDTTNLDDDRLLVSVSSMTVAEGTDPFAAVTVSISRPAATDISFTPFLSNGTATAGTDFGTALQWRPAGSTDENAWTDVTGPLTIQAGQTALELRTPILDDLFFEPTERFTVNTGVISGPVANPSGAVGTVTITDSDVLVGSLAVSLVSTGNEAGTTPNVFRITRTGDTTTALVVPFTISGIRQLGGDYGDPTTTGVTFDPASSSGTITINAGQNSADLSIPTVDNAIVDGTRALPLSLAAVPGYTLSPSSAQGSILDNDTTAPPQVSIGLGNVVETDLGQIRFVNLSIQLSRPATKNTVINYDVVPAVQSDVNGRFGFDGQPLSIATPNVDYTPISGSVTLAAGLTSTIIAVPVIGDNSDENDEVLYARITSVSGGNGATISTSANRGEIIIIDNENTSGLNIDYGNPPIGITAPNGIEIRGGTGNDVITGTRFTDSIYGNEGNDYLRGSLGADVLTGGAGADIFAYNGERDPSTNARESVRATMDRIRDFAPGGGLSTGDRIQFTGQAALDLQTATGSATANGLPKAIFNATLTTALTDLNQAIQAAFRDKNLSTAAPGNQPLGLGEAVIFTQRSGRVTNTYMIVNTGSAGFDSSTDFMVDITGWSSSGFGRGQLAVSDFFQSSLI